MEHPTSPAVPAKDPLARDRIVTRSLAGRTDYLLIGMGLIAGMVLCARLCFPERLGWPIDLRLGRHATLFALPIAMGPLLVTLILIGWVLTPWRRGLELRWLAALPFPFSHEGYLRVLKRETRDNALELLVTFQHPPAQADAEGLLKPKLPGSKLVWQDAQCVLVRCPATPERRTGNAPLHHWFRWVAAPLLGAMHRKKVLKKVEVRS